MVSGCFERMVMVWPLGKKIRPSFAPGGRATLALAAFVVRPQADIQIGASSHAKTRGFPGQYPRLRGTILDPEGCSRLALGTTAGRSRGGIVDPRRGGGAHRTRRGLRDGGEDYPRHPDAGVEERAGVAARDLRDQRRPWRPALSGL